MLMLMIREIVYFIGVLKGGRAAAISQKKGAGVAAWRGPPQPQNIATQCPEKR